MKLFSSTLITWSEPLFFIIRLRERWGWVRRGLLALGITVIMFLVIFFTRNPPLGMGKTIAISLACGFVLTALLDVGNIQREVSIQEDNINYHSSMGTMWFGSFKLTDILNVRLVRPQDWTWPFGGMFIQTRDDVFLLGVPKHVSLVTVANVLHRLHVQVVLAGWEPSESDTRVKVKDEVTLPKSATQRFTEARIWPVDQSEARLNPPMVIATGITIALGPLFLSLLGLIAAGVFLFLKWGALGTLHKVLIGGGAFAALVASFLYLLWFGQYLAARYSIGVAKGVMATRRNARLSERDADLLPVEIFDRNAWTSAIVKSIDYGFLRIDREQRVLNFEGDKNRWEIPASALTACRIEEAHVGSEANQNAEKRYYVVIGLTRDGQPWEAGMVHTRTDFGSDDKERKYARAQTFFREISSIVTS